MPRRSDNVEPARGEPRETPCGPCLGRMKTTAGSGLCTKCAQMKQRCPAVLPPVVPAATAVQAWLLAHPDADSESVLADPAFGRVMVAATRARRAAGGANPEEVADRARSAGGAGAPSITISAAAPAAAAPAAAPAAADTAGPGRPLALADRALLADILAELRKVSHRLGLLVAAAGPAPAPADAPAGPDGAGGDLEDEGGEDAPTGEGEGGEGEGEE
ncbi:hypothetical protein MY11210_009699 [Beauveria gryllotalpidicola]